jgi:uncharacterized SAM-binding protein YcdF (DUF218 family)
MKRFVVGLVIFIGLVGGLLGLLFIGLPYYLAPQDKLVKADAIVAISGGETTSRTLGAVKLYDEGYAPTLIFSGAAQDPTSVSNAAAMRNIALSEGVPSSSILIEEDSVDTYENAQNTARIIKSKGITSIILVTSPYHQRRASIEFKRALGKSIKIIDHSTSDENWRRSAWWKNNYSLNLTLSEFQKVVFLYLSKPRTQTVE